MPDHPGLPGSEGLHDLPVAVTERALRHHLRLGVEVGVETQRLDRALSVECGLAIGHLEAAVRTEHVEQVRRPASAAAQAETVAALRWIGDLPRDAGEFVERPGR